MSIPKNLKGYAVFSRNETYKEWFFIHAFTIDEYLGTLKERLKKCRRYGIDYAKLQCVNSAKSIPIKQECCVVPINIKVGKIQMIFSEKKVKKKTHRRTNYIEEYLYK